MVRSLTPYHGPLLAATPVDRRRGDVLEYLIEENRVLSGPQADSGLTTSGSSLSSRPDMCTRRASRGTRTRCSSAGRERAVSGSETGELARVVVAFRRRVCLAAVAHGVGSFWETKGVD